MSNKKITYERLTQAVGVASLVIIAMAVAFGLVSEPAPAAEENQPTARGGVSNFDDITLSGDLSVGDDATVGGDLAVTGATTFGTSTMYPLLTDTASQGIYVGSTTITGTLAITASTHSLSALTSAVCVLGATPATGAGDAALCWVGLSGTTATITVEQDDWTTNASNGVIIHYAIVGTP